MDTCGADVRGGGSCALAPDHKRSHSTIAFTCDGCGKIRRGQATATENVWVGKELDDVFRFCFLCVRELI